jgi:hypothetical protein
VEEAIGHAIQMDFGKIGRLIPDRRITTTSLRNTGGTWTKSLVEVPRQKRKRPWDQGLGKIVVERRRIELPTFALRTRRSPS